MESAQRVDQIGQTRPIEQLSDDVILLNNPSVSRFLCKLGLLLSRIDRFTKESKNEMNSGICNQLSSS